MAVCQVTRCKNNKKFRPPNISFHVFPREPTLLKKWLLALHIKDKNWKWSNNKIVCSEHFNYDDFIINNNKINLKPGVVPSQKLDAFSYSFVPAASSSTVDIEDEDPLSFTSSNDLTTDLTNKTVIEKPRRSVKRKFDLTTNLTSSSSGSKSSDSNGTKKRKIAYLKSLHNYSKSPSKLKGAAANLSQRPKSYRQKVYKAKYAIKKAKTKILDLKSVVNDLLEKKSIPDDIGEHLSKCFEGIPQLLMRRYLKNVHNGTTSHETYPSPLRQFAGTLQFYSTKAYEYVRETFSLSLPHVDTIRKWTSNIECNAGWNDLAFQVLRKKVKEKENEQRQLICSLMLDEMSIKKQIDLSGNKTWGYVDCGTSIENDGLEAATQVLVLMVVAHQSHWKIPVAYFFINSLNASHKANIVEEALIRLFNIGVTVTSITCDGPASHFAMMEKLGCNVKDINNIKPYFSHPSDLNLKVYCIFDTYHMLKLMRNMLASLDTIKDPEGKCIQWSYMKNLHNFQENEHLHVANKLRRRHMEWHKQMMKVSLAAQTLSSSVADALEFLNTEMKVKEFEGCEATVEFIRIIDKLFDVLNSRSPWCSGYKAPLRESNEANWRPFLTNAVNYLAHCTDVSDRPIYMTPRKTPVFGFVITALAVCGLYDDFVRTHKLSYLLTYKCSLDHLETFFCSIRSQNGWNNNPTCLQFKNSFRKLLLYSNISGRGGNCRVIDDTVCLTVPSTIQSKSKEVYDMSLYRKYGFEVDKEILLDHDYEMPIDAIKLNEVAENIVTYIGGFVVRNLKKKMKCGDCVAGCFKNIVLEDQNVQTNEKLILKKNRGGLIIPSEGVSKICLVTENFVRKVLGITNQKMPNDEGFVNTFNLLVSNHLFEKMDVLFPDLSEHFQNMQDGINNHGYMLIKEIVNMYSKIRFHHVTKTQTTVLQGTPIRFTLSKLILFNNQ